MLSEIVVVCFALLALQASLGFCLPTGKSAEVNFENSNTKEEFIEKDEDDGYTVILKSPSQFLKVEVVDEDGNSSIRQLEVISSEETKEAEVKNDQEVEMNSKRTRGLIRRDDRLSKCNWRRLYRLYLKKQQTSGARNLLHSKKKRNEIREAFKTVCENPEEALQLLLYMDNA